MIYDAVLLLVHNQLQYINSKTFQTLVSLNLAEMQLYLSV
jgi:hypothetical protein